MTFPSQKTMTMQKDEQGYWHRDVNAVDPATRYVYVLDDTFHCPDPASFFQPDGVHEASQVVCHDDFHWHDENWRGIPLAEMVIYEIHTGTFTREGTFKAMIPRLEDLQDLGINTIELMPVAQFPGTRNWGYDGVYPFAVQNSYGGPQGLKELVDAAHSTGIAVILDVVYNHLGPEGNYFHGIAPYFTDKYHTPWGKAVNYDDQYGEHVKDFFVQNALYWFEHYHMDALRLDAVHAIFDNSNRPFLKQLAEEVEDFSTKKGRKFYLIAESDLNDTKIIRSREEGGYGLHAQWADDFHHGLHSLLTGEETGYYQDFGKLEDLAKAFKESFVYDGRYSSFRENHHGNSAKDLPGHQFVFCLQNHDQVGNRMLGERLASLVSFEALKLAAGALFFSPAIPLLFMGEEYMEKNPFLYFVSHSDEELIKAVREGRKREFESFKWKGEFLDPQAEESFKKSQIDWDKGRQGQHQVMRNFYRYLFGLRRTLTMLKNLDKENLTVQCLEKEKTLILQRWSGKEKMICFLNFSKDKQNINPGGRDGAWESIVDSADEQWQGPGALLPRKTDFKKQLTIQPLNFAAYITEK